LGGGKLVVARIGKKRLNQGGVSPRFLRRNNIFGNGDRRIPRGRGKSATGSDPAGRNLSALPERGRD